MSTITATERTQIEEANASGRRTFNHGFVPHLLAGLADDVAPFMVGPQRILGTDPDRHGAGQVTAEGIPSVHHIFLWAPHRSGIVPSNFFQTVLDAHSLVRV